MAVDDFRGASREEARPVGRAGGGWRDAFLNRHRRGDEELGGTAGDPADMYERDAARGERDSRDSRARSSSRPRAGSRPPRSAGEAGELGGESFNQKAVLEQDRALIEQLTQRQPRRERSAVRKPPPPPKVTPYRKESKSISSPGAADQLGDLAAHDTACPPSPAPAIDSLPSTPVAAAAVPGGGLRPASPLLMRAGAETAAQLASPATLAAELAAPALPFSPPMASVEIAAAAPFLEESGSASATVSLEPVVPRAGELFTASDIDAIMSRLGGNESQQQDSYGTAGAPGGPGRPTEPEAPTTSEVTQNFGDISQDFFRTHRMDVQPSSVQQAQANQRDGLGTADSAGRQDDQRNLIEDLPNEFQVPQRKALKEQIQAIDSWLEDDFTAREQLSERGQLIKSGQAPAMTYMPIASVANDPSAMFKDLGADRNGNSGPEADIFQKLEDCKRKKSLGERVSPVFLKDVATQAKPLFPGMSLDKLVQSLRLFTSARHEDHDLYLRILGEIPVQVRGISPDMLTTCLRVLWRLRLHEETYLELFSMEAMNMIRARRRPQARAPRRPPVPSRSVDASSASNNGGPVPVPPTGPPPDAQALAPFTAEQLIHIGNALSQLGAKHAPRFMEVYQEQLAIAIPRLTREECELVHPTLATSQLMPDTLRRAFLERCAQVDAGKPMPVAGSEAAPDIAQYQRDAEQRRKRLKHFRNIYIIAASVHKETFSFYSSLPLEVRSYLDRLQAATSQLQTEGPGLLTSQIAAVLDQLGVNCDLRRMAGPLGLHLVVKATNPNADCDEIVYECSDTGAFYAQRQDDRGAQPQYTTFTRLRQRLLQRLGAHLTHINIWEWQAMSEAQRINYMVKLQSL